MSSLILFEGAIVFFKNKFRNFEVLCHLILLSINFDFLAYGIKLLYLK